MTSVWPALCPPWKRTTMSARSDSQSTILPLPSSPHWAPTTTTFAITIPLVTCAGRGIAPKDRPGKSLLPQDRGQTPQRQQIALGPAAGDHPLGAGADEGMVPEGLAPVDVRDMHLDHRPVIGVQRVEDRDRAMAVGGGVDDDAGGLGPCLVDPVDQLAFV